jgi:flavin-dependent dehydrogenase
VKRIAIVGAGPAGSYLAWHLADAQHQVLLFDPRVPGYEKPCGGGLSPLVGRRFPDVLALPFPRHQPPCVQLRTSDGSQVEHSLAATDWAIASRADLGRALWERALDNGHVQHVRQRVTDLERTEPGWLLRTSTGEVFTAGFLVGADGVRSIVRRRLVGAIPRRHLGLAVGYRVRGAPDAVVFQSYADLEGYLWSFPRPDHASVGIGGPLGQARPRDLWQRLDRFLDDTCPGAHIEKQWAALLPMARDSSLWDTPCAGPGWALLGDAAGHVHPLTGEGIAYALWSAELLAEAFEQGDPQAYERLWRARYGQGLMAASELLCDAGVRPGTYEAVFQLAMMMALYQNKSVASLP